MEAAEWDERYRSAELVWGSEPNLFVRQQCDALPVGEALDLACGEGRNALWLAHVRCTGARVDQAATAALQQLRQRAASAQQVSAQVHVQRAVVDVERHGLRIAIAHDDLECSGVDVHAVEPAEGVDCGRHQRAY